MVKLLFKDKTLEKIFRHWRYNRNNTLQLFEIANKHNAFNYTAQYKTKDNNDKSVLYQFQCLATTTNVRYRLLTGGEKTFGVFIKDGKTVQKSDLPKETLDKILKQQIEEMEDTYRSFSAKDFDKNIYDILSLTGHEHLHQGQLIVLFREAGIPFPDRFQKAWAL